MNLRNRITQLEKQTQPPAANPYMTMDLQELYARAWQAVEDGKTITPQDTNPATEALRADILRRLQRIANEQNTNTINPA